MNIDSETAWQAVFDTLDASEQSCIRSALGDDMDSVLEQPVLDTGDWMEEIYPCLDPEYAQAIFLSTAIAGMERDYGQTLREEEVSCLRELVASDLAIMIVAPEDSPEAVEFAAAAVRCVPDAIVSSIMPELGMDAEDPSEEERLCLREVIRDIDWEAIFSGDASAERAKLGWALISCVPDVFLSRALPVYGLTLEDLEEAGRLCLREVIRGIDWVAAMSDSSAADAQFEAGMASCLSEVPVSPAVQPVPTETARPVPVAEPEQPRRSTGEFASVSAGTFYSCALRSDGSMICWGDELAGVSAAMAAGTAPPEGPFTSISVGQIHTCAVRTDGSVACWGHDEDGQASPLSGTFASVSAGPFHSCAVRTDGSAACWGDDAAGRATPPSGEFASVSAGTFHSCGVTTNGSVACWGRDEHGQAMPPRGSFSSVSAGEAHTCGVQTDGSVACWGDDSSGQTTPPPGEFASVSAGTFHSCAVTTGGRVACWGDDEHGQATPP